VSFRTRRVRSLQLTVWALHFLDEGLGFMVFGRGPGVHSLGEGVCCVVFEFRVQDFCF
jgi:hypothetical protein